MNERFAVAFSKIWKRKRKRKRENLGKVVSVATQEIIGFSVLDRSEDKVMENNGPENESRSSDVIHAIEL